MKNAKELMFEYTAFSFRDLEFSSSDYAAIC